MFIITLIKDQRIIMNQKVIKKVVKLIEVMNQKIIEEIISLTKIMNQKGHKRVIRLTEVMNYTVMKTGREQEANVKKMRHLQD